MSKLVGNGVNVYVAALPHGETMPQVHSQARADELATVTNSDLKLQKSFVWKLLEYALNHALGLAPSDVRFTKTAQGKWLCDACYLSLSHSKDALAVAVSRKAVGVDIELLSPPKQSVIERVLTESERAEWQSCAEEDAWRYLITVWAKKESAFKRAGEGSFAPSKIDTAQGRFAVRTVTVGDEAYALAVATEQDATVQYFEHVNLWG